MTCHAKLRVLNQVGRNRRKAPITFLLQYFFLCVFFWVKIKEGKKAKEARKKTTIPNTRKSRQNNEQHRKAQKTSQNHQISIELFTKAGSTQVEFSLL